MRGHVQAGRSGRLVGAKCTKISGDVVNFMQINFTSLNTEIRSPQPTFRVRNSY